jgi:hypothetical protein
MEGRLPQENWVVPIDYVLSLISAFVGVLGLLWVGVVARVFVNNERRLVTLEEYKGNEEVRTQLLVTRFREMLLETELRIGRNLESKRASIEGTITEQVAEVVKAVKNGGV